MYQHYSSHGTLKDHPALTPPYDTRIVNHLRPSTREPILVCRTTQVLYVPEHPPED